MTLKRQHAWVPHLTAAQMLQVLSQLPLRAALQHGALWLAADGRTARLLGSCCVGYLDGGPGTAAQVAALVGRSDAPSGWWDVELLRQLGEGAQQAQLGRRRQGGEALASTHEQAQRQGQAQGQGRAEQLEEQLRVTQQKKQREGEGQQQQQEEEQQQQQEQGQQEQQHEQQQQQRHPTRDAFSTAVQPSSTAAAAAGDAAAAHQPGGELVAVRLCPEEAFFMHYVLGSLTVMESSSAGAGAGAAQPPAGAVAGDAVEGTEPRPLTTDGLWRWCMGASGGGFASGYAAYHHLRAKGWCPRPGLLYGVDYVAYALHPSVSHSEYLVRVLPVRRGRQQAGLQPGSGQAQLGVGQMQPGAGQAQLVQGRGDQEAAALSWLDVQAMNRLAQTVFKRLLLLYVVLPEGEQALAGPGCLVQAAVQEVLVKRWVATSNQQQQQPALKEGA